MMTNFGGQGSSGVPAGGFFNWPKPSGYNFWNPQATQTQNQAFNIPGYNKFSGILGQGLKDWQGKTYDELSPYRAEQGQALSVFSNALNGGPSYASMFLKGAQEDALKSALSQGATVGAGGIPGLTARNLASQTAQQNLGFAAEGGKLRLQEGQQYFDALSQMRQQDLALENTKNQMIQYYLNTGLNLNQAQASANQALESLLSGQYQAAQAVGASLSNAQTAAGSAQETALIGLGAKLGGSLLGGVAGGY